MIAYAAEPCFGQSLFADARMAVGGDDQVAVFSYFRSHDKFRVHLNGNFNAGGAGRGGEPVFGVRNHHPDDVDAAPAQHLQGRHAEMAGADKGDPHGVSSA
jgi:hypothetical protein